MPNLFSALPVEIFLWVLASTSGLMRSEIGAVLPSAAARADSSSSSGSDSTLKQRMPACEREIHFARGLADARKQDLVGRNAGGQCAAQFAFRNHVGAGAELCQRAQHRLVGIRLHGVADQRVEAGEGLWRRRGNGGSASPSNSNRTACRPFAAMSGIGHVLGMQHAVAIVEMVHGNWSEKVQSSGSRMNCLSSTGFSGSGGTGCLAFSASLRACTAAS